MELEPELPEPLPAASPPLCSVGLLELGACVELALPLPEFEPEELEASPPLCSVGPLEFDV